MKSTVLYLFVVFCVIGSISVSTCVFSLFFKCATLPSWWRGLLHFAFVLSFSCCLCHLVKPQSAMSQRMFRLWELCSIWLCLCATRYAVARVGEDTKWSAIGIWDSRYGTDSLSADNQTVADRDDAWQRQCGAFSVASATAVWNTSSLACILDDAALCVPKGVETIGLFNFIRRLT